MIKGKIWHFARFLSLAILVSFFVYSLFCDIKIKSIFFFAFLFVSLILCKFKRTTQILIKIIILSLSILLFKYLSNFFNYGHLDFINYKELYESAIQILNISNSIFFSYLFLTIYPLKKISLFDSINNLVESISKVSYQKMKDKKIKINSLSSFFAVVIYESYKIFFDNEEKC